MLGMVNPTFLAPGHVDVIKQKVLIITSTKLDLEELNDCKNQSPEASK
jgi:hypothetical protein